ncbi:MAG: TIGR00730 family Rossman fold protein [Cyanobacteria bacterium REEB67]|nr:TIGR00730 family Rossman fold protein [Cyanobacteria bacterium REEB67]
MAHDDSAKSFAAEIADSGTAAAQFSSHALDSFKYNLLQVPANSVAQIVDYATGKNILPDMQWFAAPKEASLGSAAWAGDIVGNTMAAAVPLVVFHKLAGPGAATSLEISADYGLNKTAMPVLAKTAALGAAYGAFLTPTSGDNSHFWQERGSNAVVSALALTTMTAGSIGLKATGKAFLASDVVAAGASGAAAGVVDADGHSLLQGRGFATGQERLRSMAAWSFGSALGGGANTLHEVIAPTTGIGGVRTLADMTRLADSTVQPGHPARYAFESQQGTPAKAEALTEEAMHAWYNRSSVNLRSEIDNSKMPVDWRKQIVSGHQDFTYGLDALASRPNPKPIGVVYGSARFAENDFRYQRSRYIGGRAVQEGYDVMTGGGPGIMEGANRGAYEAGGTSIGVVLKLPHEKRGNGYQTLTLKHRNFFTRMENLKKADFFIVEDGGIGTGAEALDTLTHIQCGKLNEVPIYFVGKKSYGFMDKWLSQMEKAGTISPRDRDLYRIVDHPDEIFNDLRRRRSNANI